MAMNPTGIAPPPVAGALHSDVAGRTDHLPTSVADGSYVLPADVVSGLGEGNTFAGTKTLDEMFKAGPYGMPIKKIGTAHSRRKRVGKTPPGKPRFADGGLAGAGEFDPAAFVEKPPVDIMAAGGEYIVPPEKVEEIGGGDLSHGHAVLDAFVKQTRDGTIKTLRKLPGPAKS